MPSTPPAPAVPGNQQPRPAPLTTPPSLRRPPPANRPQTPRPMNSRKAAVRLPYPPLPELPQLSSGKVSRADFDRAYFLRCVAELQAGKDLLNRMYRNGGKDSELAARMFLIDATDVARRALRASFADWMESCGGMAGPGFKPTTGGAA